MDRDELLRNALEKIEQVTNGYGDIAGVVYRIARDALREHDAHLKAAPYNPDEVLQNANFTWDGRSLNAAPHPSTAAIMQVMDADGKNPSEKQPMTITATTNAAPGAGVSEERIREIAADALGPGFKEGDYRRVQVGIHFALSERGEREGFVSVPRSTAERTEAMFRSVAPQGAIALEWKAILAARPGQEEGSGNEHLV